MRPTILVAVIALAGCFGELDVGPTTGTGSGSGSGSDAARVDFNDHVYATLATKCGGCHTASRTAAQTAPGFVDPTAPAADAFKAWQTITAQSLVVGNFTSSANLLALPASGHEGTSYTTAEQSAIASWLTLELQWRNAAGEVDLLAKFSGCLTKTDFDAAQMSQAWAQNVMTNEGTCESCHSNGTGHFMATMQDDYMFSTLTTDRAYLSTFFTVDSNKVIINQAPFTTAASGLTASGQHPAGWGNGMDNAGMQALQALYASAVGQLAFGGCGPSTLTN